MMSYALEPLEAAEERRLARRVEAGAIARAMLDPDDPAAPTAPAADLEAVVRQADRAKETIVFAHVALVRAIANEVARLTDVDADDLFQEGCLVLEKTIPRFDYERGRLAPFAAKALRHGLRDWAYTEAQISRASRRRPAPAGGGDVRAGLTLALAYLPRDIRRVVELRHGWGGGAPATLEQVAYELRLSLAVVRRLERRGLDLLRRYWEAADDSPRARLAG
jgi:DNA-directed RNA polymerase sigma subunit (sigma70/sigma32)